MEALRAEQRVKSALAARIEELEAAAQPQPPPQPPPPASPGGTPDLSVLLAQERLRTADLQKVPAGLKAPSGPTILGFWPISAASPECHLMLRQAAPPVAPVALRLHASEISGVFNGRILGL